jgi:predicted transcriptional regulator
MASRSPKTDELRNAPLGLRIRPSLKAALEELAETERRTLASYVELALEDHVEAKRKEVKRR